MVFGRDRQIEAEQAPPLAPQAIESLRARDLVHEVQVDVDEVGFAVLAFDDEVVVPDLLGQGARAIGDRCAHVGLVLQMGVRARDQLRDE